MNESLDELYFDWLKDIILPAPNGKRYDRLIDILHEKEFIPMIEMDENRAADGIFLREKFAEVYLDFCEDPCSILEMMIALAGRFDGNAGFDPNEAYENFWILIKNLGLDRYHDSNYSGYEVRRILYSFTNRTYEYSGKGGLFPLKNPRKDQRNVEIWEQLQAYLIEKYGV